MKKIKGIRKRWMMNTISVVLFIVLLAVTAFCRDGELLLFHPE